MTGESWNVSHSTNMTRFQSLKNCTKCGSGTLGKKNKQGYESTIPMIFVIAATVRSTLQVIVHWEKKTDHHLLPTILILRNTKQIKIGCVPFFSVHSQKKTNRTVKKLDRIDLAEDLRWGFYDSSFSHNDSERLVRCLKIPWILPVGFFGGYEFETGKCFLVFYSWCNNELIWSNWIILDLIVFFLFFSTMSIVECCRACCNWWVFMIGMGTDGFFQRVERLISPRSGGEPENGTAPFEAEKKKTGHSSIQKITWVRLE